MNTPPRYEKKRVFYIDVLNILAILMVVALHQNGYAIFNYQSGQAWHTSMIIECLCYAAVPIFVMITGANLLNYHKKYDTKTYFKKRLLKVVIPAIAWFAIMFIWKVFITKTLILKDYSLGTILDSILSCRVESTYYFIFAIIGVYLAIPLVSHLAEPKNRKLLWYGITVYFIINALVPNLSLFNIHLNGNIQFPIVHYMVYVFLGYALSTTKIQKKYRILLYTLGILSVLYQYLSTIWLSDASGKLITSTWGYFQFFTILEASAIFVFFKHLDYSKFESNHLLQKIIPTLASCSFGIYLFHKIIIHYENVITNINVYSWQYRLLFIPVTYLVSLLIIYALKKIPYMRKIVP